MAGELKAEQEVALSAALDEVTKHINLKRKRKFAAMGDEAKAHEIYQRALHMCLEADMDHQSYWRQEEKADMRKIEASEGGKSHIAVRVLDLVHGFDRVADAQPAREARPGMVDDEVIDAFPAPYSVAEKVAARPAIAANAAMFNNVVPKAAKVENANYTSKHVLGARW